MEDYISVMTIFNEEHGQNEIQKKTCEGCINMEHRESPYVHVAVKLPKDTKETFTNPSTTSWHPTSEPRTLTGRELADESESSFIEDKIGFLIWVLPLSGEFRYIYQQFTACQFLTLTITWHWQVSREKVFVRDFVYQIILIYNDNLYLRYRDRLSVMHP